MTNPYDAETSQRRTGRRIVNYRIPAPDLLLQPALSFDPPQPAPVELSIAGRFAAFHAANPQVYAALRTLALAQVRSGARVIRTKRLFEQLRDNIGSTGEDGYRLNNIFTAHYGRLLDQEPELHGRVTMREIKAE